MKKLTFSEYRKITLEVLKEIDKICEENQLYYSLGFGSLIGAIRHQGFIPWDDDIDIVMPREDYNKLEKIINENEYNINFITLKTNSSTIFSYGKICMKGTKVIEANYRSVEGYGAFVDVFPIDNAPELLKERKIMSKIILFERRKLQHATKKRKHILEIGKQIY